MIPGEGRLVNLGKGEPSTLVGVDDMSVDFVRILIGGIALFLELKHLESSSGAKREWLYGSTVWMFVKMGQSPKI